MEEEEDEMQIGMMVNSRMRAARHQQRMGESKSGNQEEAERMSEGRDTEIQT